GRIQLDDAMAGVLHLTRLLGRGLLLEQVLVAREHGLDFFQGAPEQTLQRIEHPHLLGQIVQPKELLQLLECARLRAAIVKCCLPLTRQEGIAEALLRRLKVFPGLLAAPARTHPVASGEAAWARCGNWRTRSSSACIAAWAFTRSAHSWAAARQSSA